MRCMWGSKPAFCEVFCWDRKKREKRERERGRGRKRERERGREGEHILE